MTVEDYYVDGKRIPAAQIDLNDANQERPSQLQHPVQ